MLLFQFSLHCSPGGLAESIHSCTLIFYNMKVYCVFSLHMRYIQYTIFTMKKKNNLNYPKSAAIGFFSKGLKNEFETAVVNEPSVFEPLKFYCISSLGSKFFEELAPCESPIESAKN